MVKAKDRDGVYRRRGIWGFDYKDPSTGQWRSRSTGTRVYNEAREAKRTFLESLNSNYHPSNDRIRFTLAADASWSIGECQHHLGRFGSNVNA
jgi:hypothetical protein